MIRANLDGCDMSTAIFKGALLQGANLGTNRASDTELAS